MAKILIVDDAQFMRNILKKMFKEAGHEIVGEAGTADEGIEKFKAVKPDIITMDICMPKKSGIEGVKQIMKLDSDAKILVCSALGQELLIMEAIQAGAKDFIVKPFKKENIIETIQKIIEK